MPPLSTADHDDDFSLDWLTEHSDCDLRFAVAISPKASRSVTFAPTTTIHPVLHINEYSDIEKNNTWYNKSEISVIRQESKIESYGLGSGFIREDDKEHCGRGLDLRTDNGPSKRRQNMTLALHTVITEQHRQRDQGILDIEHLALVYCATSYICKVRANEIARHDEQEAHSKMNTKLIHCIPNDETRINSGLVNALPQLFPSVGVLS